MHADQANTWGRRAYSWLLIGVFVALLLLLLTNLQLLGVIVNVAGLHLPLPLLLLAIWALGYACGWLSRALRVTD